ncbi:MAG: hypothetical protein MI724_15430, partial [Spirochaetales bacterium]|nr:hypothetical protein [Spirochaetales bacterium]
NRIAATFFVTDGQVHDVPAADGTTLGGPVHVILTGERRERCARGNVGTTMLSPQRLMHIRETVFFLDLSHGLVMIER